MILAHTILVTGRVQGVGFRPFVSRMAHRYHLGGWVCNQGGQVHILVEGHKDDLAAFEEALIREAPPLACPNPLSIEGVATYGWKHFFIKDSESSDDAYVHIPPDHFVCEECLAEMRDPKERRYGYPFINCTQCGPRYTLIDRLPYDRVNTAMASFPLCHSCLSEYHHLCDRRYHAQPLACPKCGPTLTFRRSTYPDIVGNEDALVACVHTLQEGKIVAVKGIGGYHLLCSATCSLPILKLRQNKPRLHKPLAVLVPSEGVDGLDWVRRLTEPNSTELEALASPQRPIVLMQKKQDTCLSEWVAPGLNEVGLMLPYSPLHDVLARYYNGPLIATSANVSGEPVLTEADEIEARLGRVADAFLHHDRPIRRPADDSVLRRIAGKVRSFRIGRGYAPQELYLPFHLDSPLLAVGADLKNTVALAFQNRVVLSPHIGDLETARSMDIFEQVIADLSRLYGVYPSAVVHDTHPHYHGTRWAKTLGLRLFSVLHHHAHASSLVGEHAIQEPCLVFTWDGTGYGAGGALWGGETLLGQPGNWKRVASLRPFHLPGAEKASRAPWRCALGVCWEVGQEWLNCPKDYLLLKQAWQQGIQSPSTSSAGRLFDAAAALIGRISESTYEGQAAMMLEACCDDIDVQSIELPCLKDKDGLYRLDWEPLLYLCMDDQKSVSERASIFHVSLAAALAKLASALSSEYSVQCVGFSGGVFQNRVLTELIFSHLTQLGLKVYLHKEIPAGDGGISYGQIIEVGTRLH